MPDDADLEQEMQFLWDHGNVLSLTVPFDLNAAVECEGKLRDCATRARANNRLFGAGQLERMASQLAQQIKSAV
jgi:hypothetical protein